MGTTLTNKTVKTRKPHQCYSCYRKFPTGTKMNYWTGIYDGYFNSVYSCMACVEVMNMSDETEFPEGFVDEMLENGETPEDMLERWYTESNKD